MLDFLFFILGLTLLAIIVNVCIKVFVIRPGQLAKIKFFIEDGKLKEALLYVNLRLKRQPDNLTLGYWQAEILWRLDNKPEAIEVFKSLSLQKLKKTPSYYAQTLFRLAVWYCEQNQLEQSTHYFDELFKLKTDDAEHYSQGACLALKKGDVSEAIQLLEAALQRDNTSYDILLLLGDTYASTEAYNEAYNIYARMVQLYPDLPQLWLKLADISFKAGNFPKAIKFYNKAETFPAPLERYEAARGLFNLYKTSGELFQAIQSVSKAIAYSKPEFCPNDKLLELHYELAELYISVEEIDQAVRQWEIILKINPNYRDVSVKYADFSHLRLSDFFKDLLTLNGTRLIEVLIAFLKDYGLTVDSYLQGPGFVNILTVENANMWRNSRRIKTLFSFWCSSEAITLAYVDGVKSYQNTSGAQRAYVISAGPALSEARQLLTRRAIDFFDASNIIQLKDQISSGLVMEDLLEA